MAKPKSYKFTIYLLKGEQNSSALTEKLVSDYLSEEQAVAEHKLSKNIDAMYVLSENNPAPPPWAKFYELDDVFVKTAHCVFFVPFQIGDNQYRVAAICYGHSRHLLDKKKVVNDFGFRVGLNLIDKGKIRQTSVRQPSELSKQRTIQTSHNADLANHDFKQYTDILKGGTGRTNEDDKDAWGTTVTFTDASVSLSLPITKDKLPGMLSRLFDVYERKDYEEKFPECLFCRPVTDDDLIQELDDELVSALKRQDQDIDFDFPKVIDYENFGHFQIVQKGKKIGEAIDDDCPTIDGIYSNFCGKEHSEFDRNYLESTRVIIKDQNGNKTVEEKLYYCLVWDTNFKSQKYHFSGGNWHLINDDALGKISKNLEGAYEENIAEQYSPIEFKHDNEAEYNKDFASKMKADLLDRENIKFWGGQFELCDILLKKHNGAHYLIHVKRMRHKSSNLGHLFGQGTVALTAVRTGDDDAMKAIQEKAPDLSAKSEIVVHYLIIRKGAKRELPFFSQVRLHEAINEIRSKGGGAFYTIVAEKPKDDPAPPSSASPTQ